MKKLLIVLAPTMAIILLAIVSPTVGFGHTHPSALELYKTPVPAFSKELVQDRLQNLSSVLDIRYTPEVGRRIKEYTVSYRAAGERILGKVDLYFPLFEEELKKRNLPQELKYVAVVESHLNPFAVSKSGATGLWQFIKSTARMHGLNIDTYQDERKDPVRSTQAALEYLESLYKEFGDWTLAIAAYNCGPGGIRSAKRKSGGSSYWEIRGKLPKETQKYVPRVVAAMYLMQYYHMHNLSPKEMSADSKHIMDLNDGKPHKFKELAVQLDVDYKLLKRMNAQFTTDHFPKNAGNLILRIPDSKYEKYLEIYSPVEYKSLLVKRKNKELAILKAEKDALIASRKIFPMAEIGRRNYDRIRFTRNKKIYYTVFG